jgi:AraC family transcriptional activator of tynA and feaB
MLLLDTRDYPAGERLSVFQDSSFSSIPMSRIVEKTEEPFNHRVEAISVAPGCAIMRDQGSGLRGVRGPNELRIAAPEATTFTVVRGARAASRGPRYEVPGTVGDLFIADQTSYAEYQWWGSGGHDTLVLENRVLGLPVDVVRKASSRSIHNQLSELLSMQISKLLQSEVDSASPTARALVASSCADLARAVVTSAVNDSPQRKAALDDVLPLRIETYIGQHLTDRALNAQQIAQVHHISVRQLYNIWSGRDLTLSEHIMTARLEGARRELGNTQPSNVSLGWLAMRWGFSDPAHFSRRFRAAYGLAPRDWYAAHIRLASSKK